MKKESIVSEEPETSKDHFYCGQTMKLEEDHFLVGENNKENIHSSMPIIKEIKIKITKKQLSELMNKTDVEDLSIHQLLTKLMNVDEGLELVHRSWRPVLHTIHEVN